MDDRHERHRLEAQDRPYGTCPHGRAAGVSNYDVWFCGDCEVEAEDAGRCGFCGDWDHDESRCSDRPDDYDLRPEPAFGRRTPATDDRTPF